MPELSRFLVLSQVRDVQRLSLDRVLPRRRLTPVVLIAILFTALVVSVLFR